MISKEEYVIITPDVSTLVEHSTPKKKMCNISLVDNEKKSGDDKSVVYACPAKGCPRNAESPRQQFFPVFYNLKMHYLSVHSEKKFQCTSCTKRFGNEVVFRHHKKTCKQQVHECECGHSYTSRNALLTHARRKQHKIVEVEGNKKSTGKKSSGVTVPGIAFLASKQCLPNLKITHPVKCQSILKSTQSTISNTMIPGDKAFLPRLIRILPKVAQSAQSACVKKPMDHNKKHVVDQQVIPVLEKVSPVVSYEEPLIQNKQSGTQQETVITTHESEEKEDFSSCKQIIHPELTVQEDPVLVAENKLDNRKTILKEKTGIVLDEARNFSFADTPLSENASFQHNVCYKPGPVTLDATQCPGEHTTFYKQASNSIVIGDGKTTLPKVTRQRKSRKSHGNAYKQRSSTKCRDVFDEISTSAKKLAHMFTQTAQSFDDIEESHPQKKVAINTQTQVDASDLLESPTRATMDMQTQISYYNCNDLLKKSTMDTHTQIDSHPYGKLPVTLNTDTQTQINSYNFNDILKKLTMDTQTEINTYNFNPSLKSTTESMDTQTEINLYNFNDNCIKSTVEMIDSQTEMKCDLNELVLDGVDTLATADIFNFDDKSILEETATERNEKQSLGKYIAGVSKKQCNAQTCIDDTLTKNLFNFSDNETQTESVNPWLSDFSFQDYSTMGTQTNFMENFMSNGTQTNFIDNYISNNFGIAEPSVLDKSIQLDDMISLNDTRNIILTESSNISTQTVCREKDLWFNESLLCESSSTQTDYFENFDFMDVDFHIDDGGKNLSNKMTPYCKDALISGNISSEKKTHMETQTTIPLYDMLESPLTGNFMGMDKNIVNIETQTTDILPEMFDRPTSSIETQTDLF